MPEIIKKFTLFFDWFKPINFILVLDYFEIGTYWGTSLISWLIEAKGEVASHIRVKKNFKRCEEMMI